MTAAFMPGDLVRIRSKVHLPLGDKQLQMMRDEVFTVVLVGGSDLPFVRLSHPDPRFDRWISTYTFNPNILEFVPETDIPEDIADINETEFLAILTGR